VPGQRVEDQLHLGRAVLDQQDLDGRVSHAVDLLLGPKGVAALFRQIPLLTVTEGYWDRAGSLRGRLLERGRRAPLADALIAQSCLDHGVPLVTRDADFRHISRVAALRLLP
jgi:predicted nucleic acid-binding protein